MQRLRRAGGRCVMRIIDLSVPLANDVPADPPDSDRPHRVHGPTTKVRWELAGAFPGLLPEQLPEGKGWAVERVQITTHNGTHMDAPWHYHPTMDGGARAMTIDEVPLDWCIRPGGSPRLPIAARRPPRHAGGDRG